MPFQEGNKLGGRKEGSTNKSTSKVRNAFAKLVEDNLPTLKDDLEKIEPKDRVKLLLDLAKYVIPTLKATEHSLPNEILNAFKISEIYNDKKAQK